jgi:alpha-methylacyl-CoA racemase
MSGPLEGLRVLEFASIGPCPFAGMVLADLGADVLRVERVDHVGQVHPAIGELDLLQRGKSSLGLDLKGEGAASFALNLVAKADVLIEGYRPGVMERFGLGPVTCHARNAKLIYGRMTGWGQDGPLANRAGHDIDYIALSGALDAIGRRGERPVVPLNLLGDFGGGGMLLVIGVLSALYAERDQGVGQVVDAAMLDGAALLTTMFHGMRATGRWRGERGTNVLDSGAPFYEVYECADGKMIAVGAIESQFYELLLEILDVDIANAPAQFEQEHWPETKRRFAATFATRTRADWLERAAQSDACITPVLTMAEAPFHDHTLARNGFIEIDGVVQPAPAPRFSVTHTGTPRPPIGLGDGGMATITAWGVPRVELEDLVNSGVVVAR